MDSVRKSTSAERRTGPLLSLVSTGWRHAVKGNCNHYAWSQTSQLTDQGLMEAMPMSRVPVTSHLDPNPSVLKLLRAEPQALQPPRVLSSTAAPL